jgi:hypothetical protein
MPLRFLTDLTKRHDPAITLFFLKRGGRTLGRCKRLPPRRAISACPRSGVESSQWCAVGCEGMQRMQQSSAPCGAVEWTRSQDLLFRPCEIDFRCVLWQNHHRLFVDAPSRGLLMWLENAVKGNLVIVEQAIGSFHFGPAAASRRYTSLVALGGRPSSLTTSLAPGRCAAAPGRCVPGRSLAACLAQAAGGRPVVIDATLGVRPATCAQPSPDVDAITVVYDQAGTE